MMTSNGEWEHGDAYEQYIGRWSRKIAPQFLTWLDLPAGLRWLDVGCGTGALCGAILKEGAPASVTGVEPSAGFIETAKARLAGRAMIRQGSATEIPLDDDSVDVVVSGLALNFVPDQPAALREMARVTRPDGTIAAYVWDYAGKMELIRYFWDVAGELDSDARALDEAVLFPRCTLGGMEELFSGANFGDIEVKAIDIQTSFATFDEYWRPFLGGQGPAPTYLMSLPEPQRVRLRDALRERLPIGAGGSIELVARAWGARGTDVG